MPAAPFSLGAALSFLPHAGCTFDPCTLDSSTLHRGLAQRHVHLLKDENGGELSPKALAEEKRKLHEVHPGRARVSYQPFLSVLFWGFSLRNQG